MDYIGIVGFGYVGYAVALLFADHFQVRIYDPFVKEDDKRLLHKNISLVTDKADIDGCDMVVVCVPTPMKETNEVDLSIIKETIDWLGSPLILIKSTVPPTTTKKLVEKTGKKIAFSPEFIGEGKYVVQWWKDRGYPHPTDMKYHDFQIFGGDRKVTVDVLQFFKKVLGPGVQYIQTDSVTAEMVKYMENSWGATKVIFCNEFARMAETFGVDYDELRELFLLDGRTERMHTAVFKDDRGFGGKCFPKDVNGIVKASEKAGFEPKLLKSVLRVNNEIRKSNGQKEV